MSAGSIVLQAGEAIAAVRDIETHGGDATALMKDLLLLMIRSAQLNFEAQGRPERWADLADSTIRRRSGKALKAKGAPKLGSIAILASILILRDTGKLLQSVGGGASGAFDAEEGFGESDELTATIGTNHPGWHNQFEDTRGWRDARPFLLWQDVDVEDSLAMAEDWMLRRGPYASS